MEFVDYYAILGVKKDVSDAELKKAFRRLARKHHPDLNPDDTQANKKFAQINEAYEVLSDPERKTTSTVKTGNRVRRTKKRDNNGPRTTLSVVRIVGRAPDITDPVIPDLEAAVSAMKGSVGLAAFPTSLNHCSAMPVQVAARGDSRFLKGRMSMRPCT